MENQRQGESKKIKIIVIIVVACLVLIGAGVGAWMYLGGTKEEEPQQADPVEAQAAYETMQEEVVTDNDDPMYREIDFDALKERNPDVYAWIWIPGTNIDYPILQSTVEADDYYLNTTIDGQYGLPGSIYTEKYNSQYFTDPVTVVYGHELKDGTMFSELHKYEDKAFFDQYPYIYIYQPGLALKYQIFAAVSFDDRYILGNYNFMDTNDFQKYLDELLNSINGNVNRDVYVAQETTILTLSTCISAYPDQRWLVNGAVVDFYQPEAVQAEGTQADDAQTEEAQGE